MKIIKIPQWSIIKCECGCEYEIDKEDVSIETMTCENLDGTRKIIMTWYVSCPFCNKRVDLKK